jgi:hypothetical protein
MAWMVTLILRPIDSKGRSHWIGSAVGFRTGANTFGEYKNGVPLWGIEPRFLDISTRNLFITPSDLSQFHGASGYEQIRFNIFFYVLVISLHFFGGLFVYLMTLSAADIVRLIVGY